MRFRLFPITFITLIGAMLVLSGCPPKKKLAIEDVEEQVEELVEGEDGAIDGMEDIEISQDWSEIPALGSINFGYDAAKLDTTAKSTLKENVAILKKLPQSVSIRVEGHCDDRGTIEYNIALGQRRANVVRAYYTRAGIAKGRLETISYGEERPICNFQTDDCWAQNRRAVTKVRNKEAITVKSTELQ